MTRYAKPEKGSTATSNIRTSSSTNEAFDVVKRHLANLKKKGGRGFSPKVDAADIEIINYMLAGLSSTEIAQKMKRPLTTVQRRSKRLIDKGYVVGVIHINFKKFGLRRGLLHFKCKTTEMQEAVEKIAAIKGVESASGYLGSLDIIANVVYADSTEVLSIIRKARDMNLVTDVTWSEEIHSVPI